MVLPFEAEYRQRMKERKEEEEEKMRRKEQSARLSPETLNLIDELLNMDPFEQEKQRIEEEKRKLEEEKKKLEEKQKKIAKKILPTMPIPFTDYEYFQAYRRHTGEEMEPPFWGYCRSLDDVYDTGKAEWDYIYIPQWNKERQRNRDTIIDMIQNLRLETLWRECREVFARMKTILYADQFENAYERIFERRVPLRSCCFSTTSEMLTKMTMSLGNDYFYLGKDDRAKSPWKEKVEEAVLAACRALEMPFTLDDVCEKFSHQQGTVTCTKDTRRQLAKILGSLQHIEPDGPLGLFNYREVEVKEEEEDERPIMTDAEFKKRMKEVDELIDLVGLRPERPRNKQKVEKPPTASRESARSPIFLKKQPAETKVVEKRENEMESTGQAKKKRSLLDCLEEDEDCWPKKSGRPGEEVMDPEENVEKTPDREERPSSSNGSSNITGRTEEKRRTWPPAASRLGKGKKKSLKTKNTTTAKNTGQKVNQKPQKPISHFFKPINGDKETSNVTKVSGATEEQNLSKSPPSMAEKMVSYVEKKMKQEDDGLEQVKIRDESANKQEEKGFLEVPEEPVRKVDNFEEKNEVRLTEEAAAKKVESEEPGEEQKPQGSGYSGDDSSSAKEVFTPVELSKEYDEISEQKEAVEEEEPKNSANPLLQNDFRMTSDEPGNEENDDWIVTDVDEAMTSEEKSESEREEPKDTGEGFGEEHMEGQTKEANGIKEGQTAIGDDDELLENFSIASNSSDCDVISIESFDANDDVYDVLKTSDWMENKENIPELPKAMEEPKDSVVEEDFDFEFEEEEPIDYGFNVNKEKKVDEKGRKKERSMRTVLGVKKTPTLTRFIDSDSDTEIWGKTEELIRGGEKMEKNKEEKKQKKAKNVPSQTAPEIHQKKKKERKGFKEELKLPKKRHIDSDEEEEDVEMERRQKKKEKRIKKSEEDAPEAETMEETKSREKKPKKRREKISVN